jgi:hypothetical protein
VGSIFAGTDALVEAYVSSAFTANCFCLERARYPVALLADITSRCQSIGNSTPGDRVREQGDEECCGELHCEE